MQVKGVQFSNWKNLAKGRSVKNGATTSECSLTGGVMFLYAICVRSQNNIKQVQRVVVAILLSDYKDRKM